MFDIPINQPACRASDIDFPEYPTPFDANAQADVPTDSPNFSWYMPTFDLILPDGPLPGSTNPDHYSVDENRTADTDYQEFCSSAGSTLSLLRTTANQCPQGDSLMLVIDAINGHAFNCFNVLNAMWRLQPANQTASSEALQLANGYVDESNAIAQTCETTVQATRGKQSDQCVRLFALLCQLAGYMARSVFVQLSRGLQLMTDESMRPAEAMGATWDGIGAMLTKTCDRFAEQVPPLET